MAKQKTRRLGEKQLCMQLEPHRANTLMLFTQAGGQNNTASWCQVFMFSSLKYFILSAVPCSVTEWYWQLRFIRIMDSLICLESVFVVQSKLKTLPFSGYFKNTALLQMNVGFILLIELCSLLWLVLFLCLWIASVYKGTVQIKLAHLLG